MTQRYTVQAAGSGNDMWYVRDSMTGQPVDREGQVVIPVVDARQPTAGRIWLFFVRAEAEALAAELEQKQR